MSPETVVELFEFCKRVQWSAHDPVLFHQTLMKAPPKAIRTPLPWNDKESYDLVKAHRAGVDWPDLARRHRRGIPSLKAHFKGEKAMEGFRRYEEKLNALQGA